MCLQLMNVSGRSFFKVGRTFYFRLFLASNLDVFQMTKMRTQFLCVINKGGHSDHLSQIPKNSLKQAGSLSPRKSVRFVNDSV